jgi:hypothetical protein
LLFVHGQSACVAPVLLAAEETTSVETVVNMEDEDPHLRGDLMGRVHVLANKQLSRQLCRFIGAPKRPPEKLRDITSNQVLWTIFENAPNRPHKCSLLDGAKQLTGNHSGQALIPKMARQGKGSIADLGGPPRPHVPGVLSPFGQFKGGFKGGGGPQGQFSDHAFFQNGKGGKRPFYQEPPGGGGKGYFAPPAPPKGKGSFFHQAPPPEFAAPHYHHLPFGKGKGKGPPPPPLGNRYPPPPGPTPNPPQRFSFSQQQLQPPPNAGIDNNALRQHLAATLRRQSDFGDGGGQHKRF